MKTLLKLIPAAAVLLLASCSNAAEGPTFESEAGEGFITIYSTAAKPYRCELHVNFTFLNAEGVRKEGQRICFASDWPAGKHIMVCDAKHPMFVQPKVESVETKNCTDLKNK